MHRGGSKAAECSFEGGGTRVLDVVPSSLSGSSLAKISGLGSSCISTREVGLRRMPDANAYAMAVHARACLCTCACVCYVCYRRPDFARFARPRVCIYI